MHRLKKTLLGIILLSSWTVLLAEECKKIEDWHGNFSRTRYIREEGYYCLDQDIYQPDKSWLSWDSGGGKPFTLLELLKPKNKLLNYGGYGLNLNGYKLSFESLGKQGIHSPNVTRVKVINGKIKNVMIGINLIGGIVERIRINGNEISSEDFEDFITPRSNNLRVTSPVYKEGFSISDMRIEAAFRGIVLGGGNNTIRNSTIEVDGHTGIFNYGPNPIIENNTIIIHGKGRTTLRTAEDAVELMKGAIKLRDAKGGIIRNNRIIYKGGLIGGKAPVAINLLDSKDVLIEGNTIEGFDKLVRENGDTSYIESNNTIK